MLSRWGHAGPAAAGTRVILLGPDGSRASGGYCSPASELRPGADRDDLLLPAGGLVELAAHRSEPGAPRPLLRAALLDHQACGLPAYALFAGACGGGLLLPQAMGNLIGRVAVLADLPPSIVATTTGRGDSGPEEPVSAAILSGGAVRIDGAGPPPRLRPHLPNRQS